MSKGKGNYEAERILHAYVDNELEHEDRKRALLRIEADEVARRQVCELQRTKEWVKFSFAEERAPTRNLPPARRYPRFLQFAATVLLLIGTFGAGWYGHSLRAPASMLADVAGMAGSAHLIVHLGESDEARFDAALRRVEQILVDHADSGVQIEVVANGGGLDLVRTAVSRHIESIRSLIARYDNVRFIACSKGLGRLQQAGQNIELIDGVKSDEPAADHLIERLTEGWTIIRI